MLRHFAACSLNLLKQRKRMLVLVWLHVHCHLLTESHNQQSELLFPPWSPPLLLCKFFSSVLLIQTPINCSVRLCPWRQRSEKLSLNVAQNEVIVCIRSLSPSAANMHTCFKFLSISVGLFLAVR